MLAKVQSCAVIGIEGALVEVEVDVANGQAAFTIVGLPDATVNESCERVRSAIQNSGYLFPFKQITVNLAPADLHEDGLIHDLPIAVGILVASGQITHEEQIAEQLFLGSLSLDGSVHHINGIFPLVALASEKHVKAIFVPCAGYIGYPFKSQGRKQHSEQLYDYLLAGDGAGKSLRVSSVTHFLERISNVASTGLSHFTCTRSSMGLTPWSPVKKSSAGSLADSAEGK